LRDLSILSFLSVCLTDKNAVELIGLKKMKRENYVASIQFHTFMTFIPKQYPGHYFQYKEGS